MGGGMNELALFAGAGGGILASKMLAWRTVCAVERERYARDVLLARQNDGILEPFPIWDDVRTFKGRPWRGIVDVVSGGFPCQDISASGKGGGIEAGERSGLWREMARIVSEVGPHFVFIENSPLLTSRGLDIVLQDLDALGYDARWCVLGAWEVGAPHKRDRIWILAHAKGKRWRKAGADKPRHTAERITGAGSGVGDAFSQRRNEGRQDNGEHDGRFIVPASEHAGKVAYPEIIRSGEVKDSLGHVSDATSQRGAAGIPEPRQGEKRHAEEFNHGSEGNIQHTDSTRREEQRQREPAEQKHQAPECTDWWAVEPDVGRLANGVASRVDRLKALGNGQVPLCAAMAFRLLAGEQSRSVGGGI